MRLVLIVIIISSLFPLTGLATEQQWVEDLNQRFPGIGKEFQDAVQQKLAQHGGKFTAETLLDALLSSPDYTKNQITNTRSFGLHSELMLLYPAAGKYQDALQEAKLLRDFVLKYSPNEQQIIQTFRGVYTELLIINGQFDEALKECEALIKSQPDEGGNYVSRGVIYVSVGKLDNALADLKRLIETPDAAMYAQQLFGFIMQKREQFQQARIQSNTMIDVMLRGLEPQPHPVKIVIPALPTAAVESAEPLVELLTLTADEMTAKLGQPISESASDTAISRDYAYRQSTLTVNFDKNSGNVISAQMFFLPMVDEATAFQRIGLRQRDLPPTISSDVLKVWNPYGEFQKVRLSIESNQVIAMIVEP